ncbi:hypothetical protein E2C01_057527 [Portunus trituberculatus]|uniref:Uncharacterized protein n=1 Tax=Portunus trituberculatus TaxID=210409 RepID=A0A5B7H0K4_PORTR|nr:hypothetical protein [Portunus trituberculatus]
MIKNKKKQIVLNLLVLQDSQTCRPCHTCRPCYSWPFHICCRWFYSWPFLHILFLQTRSLRVFETLVLSSSAHSAEDE